MGERQVSYEECGVWQPDNAPVVIVSTPSLPVTTMTVAVLQKCACTSLLSRLCAGMCTHTCTWHYGRTSHSHLYSLSWFL